MAEKALAKQEKGGFLVFSQDAGALAQVIEENLGGMAGEFTALDLPRVKLPTSGGKRWDVPNPDGNESLAAIDGIIVGWHNCRGYWPGEFSGGEPPQCSSPDALMGIGDPGGECRTCPYAQFGSGRNDSGQACKQMRRLFVLQEGSVLPLLVTLPPTSIKNCTRYLVGLASKQRPYWTVVTKLGLEPTKNKGGIPYSQVTFGTVRQLTNEEIAQVRSYKESIKAVMEAAVITRDDYEIPEDGEPGIGL